MIQDQVGIYNIALAAVGVQSRVQTPTETSSEAEQCSLWYDSVRDMVLRSAPWAPARSVARLALLTERDFTRDWQIGDPDPNWRYMYALPSDCLRPRFLQSYAKFELGVSADNKRMLLTDAPSALLIYTKQQTRVDLWDVDLQHAIGFALGAHIALKLTGKPTRVQLAAQQALEKVLAARVAGANEAQFRLDTTPEWLVARGYGEVEPAPRYIYPNGDFVVNGAVLSGTA